MAAIPYDPYFNQVARLFRTTENVSSGSIFNIADESASPHVFICEGPVSITNSSLAVQGNNAITFNNSFVQGSFSGDLMLDLMTGNNADFTVECWYQCENAGQASYYACPFSFPDYKDVNTYLALVIDCANGQVGIGCSPSINSAMPASGLDLQSAPGFDGNWHHYAVVGQAGTITWYFDGVALGSLNFTNIGWGTYGAFNGGQFGNCGNALSLLIPGVTVGTANMQELRITVGTARYTQNFTPSNEPLLGWPTMPDVLGETQSQGTLDVTNSFGTIAGIEPQTSSEAPGTIVGQIPAPNTVSTSVTAPFSAYLFISLGPNPVAVPNLIGLSQEQANKLLSSVGLTLGTTNWDYSSSAPYSIFSESPSAETWVPAGSSVSYTLSMGQMPSFIPNLIGLSTAQAAQTIQNSGFEVGSILNAPSAVVPAGTVMVQSPSPSVKAVPGTLISYTVSTGPQVSQPGINWQQAILMQYRNSPRIVQLASNFAQALNTPRDLQNWFTNVWNVATARGFGLDIWGRIVGVKRLLELPNPAQVFGFGDGANPADKVGFNQAPFAPPNTPEGNSVLLPDNTFRMLILAKAMSNIAGTTLPALNTILKFLFQDQGEAYALTDNNQNLTFVFNFQPTVQQSAILFQTGVLPSPCGVNVSTQVNARTNLFGFAPVASSSINGFEPFEFGTFDTPIGS